MEEGGNISHELDKITNSGNKDSLQIYKTASGRRVLGGGGITPDYVVKYDTITMLGRNIRNKNMFFEYTSTFLNGKGASVKSKYSSDFCRFLA